MTATWIGWRSRVWRKPPKGSRVADGDIREVNTTADCHLRDRTRPIVTYRPKRAFIALRTGPTAHGGAGVDGGEEGDQAVPFEQFRGIDGERQRRSRRITEPNAGPGECIASPLLGPEEHMAVDMAPPEVGASGKCAGECRQQPVIPHLLRPQDGGAAPAYIDALKTVAVCAATRQIGNTTQLRCR
jgi:hypothetical protein